MSADRWEGDRWQAEPPRRRRVSRGGIHPGWYVFFHAFGAGMFTVFSFACTVRWAVDGISTGWTAAWCALIAIVLLALAARKAEKLTERRP